jgi:protoheme IX farnesyltransferase
MTQVRGEPLAIPQRRSLDETAAAGSARFVRDRARSLANTAAAYAGLTKPRIIVLLLITTIPAMIAAEDGVPAVSLMVATLIGGTLGAGGANALNCYFDRDIDRLMARTGRRAVPAGRIAPMHAAIFGAAIGLVGVIMLAAFVNTLASLLTAGAFAYYVVVYTLLLKRRTHQNIVIGGVAGAFPPMIGWAAVTGDVALPSILMFLLVIVWTPAHFWALALVVKDDYDRAQIPMLPAVAGDAVTRRQILLYGVLTVAVSLALSPAASLGPLYLGVALSSGLLFIGLALRLVRVANQEAAINLFRYSIVYLGVLFVAIALDELLIGTLG